MLPASTRSAASLPRYVVISVRAARLRRAQHEGQRERRHDAARASRSVPRRSPPARRWSTTRPCPRLRRAAGSRRRASERDVVGHTLVLETVEHRELAAAVGRIEAPAQRQLPALDHAKNGLRSQSRFAGSSRARELLLERAAAAHPRTPRASRVGSSRSPATDARTRATPASVSRSQTPARISSSLRPSSAARTIHGPISFVTRSPGNGLLHPAQLWICRVVLHVP